MRMKKFTILLLLFFLTLASNLSAENMQRNTVMRDPKMEKAIEEYVQQVITNYLLKTCGEIMQDIITRQNLQLFPVIAYQASQQAAFQLFTQPDVRDMLWGIFDENTTQAKDQSAMGMPQGYIEAGIKERVERDVKLLVNDPSFRYVIEAMLDQAVLKQRELILMTVAQQQTQLMSLQAQQQATNQQIQNSVKNYLVK